MSLLASWIPKYRWLYYCDIFYFSDWERKSSLWLLSELVAKDELIINSFRRGPQCGTDALCVGGSATRWSYSPQAGPASCREPWLSPLSSIKGHTESLFLFVPEKITRQRARKPDFSSGCMIRGHSKKKVILNISIRNRFSKALGNCCDGQRRQ